MSSEVSLLVELYNPLYLFPIVAVVFTALLVYAFGFKSSTQPPTEVVDALNDNHHKKYQSSQESTRKKKPTNKTSTTKTEPKSAPNGHIGNESARTSEKKTPKKLTTEQTPPVPTPKPSGKRQKNKKNEDNSGVDVEDKDQGEWVELISKKERKNRKQKEEQLLMDVKVSTKSNKNSEKSKNSKKSAKNTDVNGELKSSPKKVKEEKIEVQVNQTIEANPVGKQNGVNSADEFGSDRDVPDIYSLAKEQRPPKKTQKQRNNKRNTESEANSRPEPQPETETKPNLNVSDKLTADILANYEGTDNMADNVSNKKKKDKKKKVSQPEPTPKTTAENNGKQVSVSERKDETIVSKESVTENSSSNAKVTETKVSEEDEFKVVNKKRRARRE